MCLCPLLWSGGTVTVNSNAQWLLHLPERAIPAGGVPDQNGTECSVHANPGSVRSVGPVT
jgi:hypothetical protein